MLLGVFLTKSKKRKDDNMSKYKKQHYVPRLYLKGFAINKKQDRINVYDKSRNKFRKNQQFMNVAAENYFYDFDLEAIYESCSEEKKTEFHKVFGNDATPKSVRDKHLVEKFLGDMVEGAYKKFLDKLISSIDRAKNNSWCLKNCMCLSEDDKKEFSYYLAIQFFRGKYLPNSFTAFCEKVVGIKISENTAKLEQIKCLIDSKRINIVRDVLLKHKWVIYINNTDIDLYTSDNPFIIQPHTSKMGVQCNYLNADSVEYVFPITKSAILVIYSEKAYEVMQSKHGIDIYPDDMKPEDRRFREMNNIKQAEYYNTLQIAYSINEIYFSDDSDKFIKRTLKAHPEFLTKEYITKLDDNE
ncbi:DUF4238 domain-containing protein [Intestinibacter sp.]|uniref:DUF4238 domain-containing protein n=1 Tax=Intestinibacter sp. TaxID=1965304 RepID=UPI003AB914CB